MEKKNVKVDELTIDGTVYVPKDSVKAPALQHAGLDYVLVRTYSAGVHVGYLFTKSGKEVVLVDSIRIWYWSGAASLSQLATDGTSDPYNCKFSVPVSKITLTEAIEIIQVSQDAYLSILGVKSWKK